MPAGAPNWVTWTSAQGLVTLTPNAHGDTCTVTGTGMGLDTIIVTSRDGSNIVKRYPIEATGVLVNNITIGGRNLMKTFYTKNPAGEVLKLKATVSPDTATDKTVTWSSESTDIATVAPVGGYGVVSLAGGYGIDSIKATANDKGKFTAGYDFIVDSAKMKAKHYDYTTGYDYVDLFNNGEAYMNGAKVTASTYFRGDIFTYDAVNKWLKMSLSNSNLGRRQYYQLARPVNFSQKAVVEFDWYATTFTGTNVSQSAAEVQIAFVDADLKDIFTLYHTKDVATSFGLVAGKLYDDPSIANKTFGQDGDTYWASRSGGTTVALDNSRGKTVEAALANWYHIKAEINVVAKTVSVVVTKKNDGSAVGTYNMSLPADFVMAEGISMMLNSCAATGSGGTFEDRIDNLAIKNADVLDPGTQVSAIAISQATNTAKVIVNNTLQLRYSILPVNAGVKTVSWSSSNADYATVDEYGVLTGYEAGANQTVTITATATDGSGVIGTFDVQVIRQQVTDIALSGTRTYYVAEGTPAIAEIKAIITPANAYNKVLNWSNTSGKLTLGAVRAVVDSVYQSISVYATGNDTIKVVAADGEGAAAEFPILALPNPYPGYSYVELFNKPDALNGTVYSLHGSPMKIDLKDPLNPDDQLLRYSESNNANARAGRFTFGMDRQNDLNFTKKLLVEFDWLPTRKTTDHEGQFSLMSLGWDGAFGASAGDTIARDLFTVYNTRDTTGFGVASGPLARRTPAEAGGWGYTYTGRRVANLDAAYRTWVAAPLERWYHVVVEAYADQRISFRFTSAGSTDTFRVVLPWQAGTPKKVGQIVGVGASNSTWNSAIDNLGIKVCDADPVVVATGIDVTSANTAVALGGDAPLEVAAAIKPWNVTDHRVSWSVSDTAKARIEVPAGNPSWRAKLYGKKQGTVWAIATAHNGVKDSLSILATTIYVDSFKISGGTLVSVGRSITMTKGSVWPSNAGNQNVIWTSSNPAVASVDPVTGVVTGVNAGPSALDSVIITAWPADGGPATPQTLKVKVESIVLTKIDMWGAKRVFYTATPATVAPFTVLPKFTPATASDTALIWSSTDESILTVTQSGMVTLTGGFGKAAAKVVNPYSGKEGYYYIEVTQANPYLAFTDFEDGVAGLGGNVITLAATANATPTIALQDNSTAIRCPASGPGWRGGAATFTTALTGNGKVINMRFDWFTGRSASRGHAQLSLRNSLGVNIISWLYTREVNTDSAMQYFTATGDWNSTIEMTGSLRNVAKVNTWYTVDVNIDSARRLCSFTVTERDYPANTQTVRGVVIDPAVEIIDVKSMYFWAPRPTLLSNEFVEAIDNLGYRMLQVNYVGLTLKPNSGTFADQTNSNKLFSIVSGETFGDQIPAVSRTGYEFDGWYYSDGTTKYDATDVVSSNTTLIAKWNVNYYTVTFAGDSINIDPQSVAYGGKPSRPTPDPTRSDCYNFKGWYQTATGSTPFSFNAEITGDVTAYAQWEEDEACNEDATLSSLTLSAATISPAFNADTTRYTASVLNSVTSITLMATQNNAKGTVSGDGVKTLYVGANTFNIVVTAKDATTSRTYTVVVDRDSDCPDTLQLYNQVVALQNDTLQLHIDTLRLYKQVQSLECDTANLHAQVSVLEVDTVNLKAIIADLKVDTTSKGIAIAGLQGAVAQRTADTLRLYGQLEALQNDIVSLHTQVDILEVVATSLSGTITGLKADTAAKSTTISGLRGEVAQRNADTLRLFGQATTLKSEVVQRNADTLRLFGQVTTLKNENTNLRGEVTQRNADIVYLYGQVVALKDSITKLLNRPVVNDTVWLTVHDTVYINNSTATIKMQQSVVKLYPNPVSNGELIVENEEWKAGEVIEVYNLSGILVGTRRVEEKNTSVNVANLPNGSYVLKVGRYSAKFVKQ